jgi:hypothetical protein
MDAPFIEQVLLELEVDVTKAAIGYLGNVPASAHPATEGSPKF